MEIKTYQKRIIQFYKERAWYELNSFIRINFLTEEVGEVSRAVRDIEIGRDRLDETPKSQQEKLQNLAEEIGDVLDNLLILADKYDLNFENILETHLEKLQSRYKKQSKNDHS